MSVRPASAHPATPCADVARPALLLLGVVLTALAAPLSRSWIFTRTVALPVFLAGRCWHRGPAWLAGAVALSAAAPLLLAPAVAARLDPALRPSLPFLLFAAVCLALAAVVASTPTSDRVAAAAVRACLRAAGVAALALSTVHLWISLALAAIPAVSLLVDLSRPTPDVVPPAPYLCVPLSCVRVSVCLNVCLCA